MIEWVGRQVTVGNLMNLAVFLFVALGFYYNTNAALQRHSEEITKIFVHLEKRDEEIRTFRSTLFTELQRRYDTARDADTAMLQRLAALETEIRGLREELSRYRELRPQRP